LHFQKDFVRFFFYFHFILRRFGPLSDVRDLLAVAGWLACWLVGWLVGKDFVEEERNTLYEIKYSWSYLFAGETRRSLSSTSTGGQDREV